jgi:hypothetical protein
MRFSIRRVVALLGFTALFSLALTNVASAAVPSIPTNLTAATTSGASGSVTLTWTASSNTPTDYIIEYSHNAFVTNTYRFIDAIDTTVTETVTGLTNGLTYTFRVKGFNGDGTSAASTTAVAIPVSGHTPNDLPTFDACPASVITATEFTDTTSTDVACIKYYGITQGTTTTTYSPVDLVPRWQMALFLTRMAVPAGVTVPSGTDQGFTDISGKSTEIQTAINQIKQLGISIGKTATTFAPDQNVTREEMALFMERLLKVSTTGPGGNEELVTGYVALKEIKSLDTDHNFTDLGEASLMGMQTAIINLWNLGVTEVATATTFDPAVDMNRLNMAQMMARALDHTNARPAGVNMESTHYTAASTVGVVTISVTNRTSAFLPVADTPVDTFKYQHTTAAGYQAFIADGACANTVVTIISVTKCYIDATDQKTDTDGNFSFNPTFIAGQVWDYWAWHADVGTTYDNDIHGVGVSKITITG